MKHNRRRKQGQSLIEYALLLALVAVISIGVIGLVGPAVNRGLGVVVGDLHGSKNAAGNPSAGSTDVIYVSRVSGYSPAAPIGSAVCTTTGSKTIIKVKIVSSSDITRQDFLFSFDNQIIPSNVVGSGSWTATLTLSTTTADTSLCPGSLVLTAKKAIAIVPVVVY
ncbi:MAG: hypothetical protein ABI947_21285 [Chloroflexota bacterium]